MFDEWIAACNSGKNVIVDLSDLNDQHVGIFMRKCKQKLVRGTNFKLIEAFRSGQINPDKRYGKLKPELCVDQFGVGGQECARRIFKELRERQIVI